MKVFDIAIISLLPVNIWVGCGTAFLAALLDMVRHKMLVRDRLMAMLLAVGMTGAFIEFFLLKSAPFSCFAVGLIVGRSADSFLQSVDETMPSFSKNVVQDVQTLIRAMIAKRFGGSLPERAAAEQSESSKQPEPHHIMANPVKPPTKPKTKRRKRRR